MGWRCCFSFISLFILSDQIEKLRFSAIDNLLWDMQESGEEVNFESTMPVVISFVSILPFWYLVSCFHFWIFKESRLASESEEISEEHSSVVIKDSIDTEES